MQLNEMATAAHLNSANHGFWDDAPEDSSGMPGYLGNKLALIHSEVSEALEEIRDESPFEWYREDGKPEGLSYELADVLIRVGDLAAYLGIDLEKAVAEKMEFNASRPHKHGKAF